MTTINNYTLKELSVPIFKDGVQVFKVPDVKSRKEYCTEQFKTLYPEIKRKENPHEYYVDLTKKLLELKKELILSTKNQNTNKQYVKGV